MESSDRKLDKLTFDILKADNKKIKELSKEMVMEIYSIMRE